MGNDETTERTIRRRRTAKSPPASLSAQLDAHLRRCQRAYAVELARYSAHISSALGPESTQGEIDQAIDRFIGVNGEDDLIYFLTALAERIEARGHELGLSLVQQRIADESAARAPREQRRA